MITPQLMEMVKELRSILGQVNGVSKVEEDFNLSYLVVIDDEKQIENASRVAETLQEQAQQHGVSLEITVATQKQLDEAKDKYVKYLSEKSTFKA